MIEAIWNLGVYRVDIRQTDGPADVTYYFDQPASEDPDHPYTKREFRGETRDIMEAFEARLAAAAVSPPVVTPASNDGEAPRTKISEVGDQPLAENLRRSPSS